MISRRPNDKFFKLCQYTPFPIQREIHQSRSPMRIVCVGRQVGKSEAGSVEALFELFLNPGSVGWVIAPTYDQAEIIFSRVLDKAEKLAVLFPHCKLVAQRRKLRLQVKHYDKPPQSSNAVPVATSEFRGKSADRIDNLRGATLDYAIFDEAAMMDPNVWTEAIQPMLSTRKGWALIISTPKGYNWFYEFFLRGWRGKDNPTENTPDVPDESVHDDQFMSFHASSWEVRHDVGAEWYEQTRRNTPDIEYRQEYGAEFISHSGSVFQGIDEIIRLPYKDVILPGQQLPAFLVERPQPGGEYVIGADFGKSMDFSVFTVVDLRDGKTVCMLRTTEVAWRSQVGMLERLSQYYNDATIVADTWGVGAVLHEDLEFAGLGVVQAEFKSAAAKEEYINHLALLIENGLVALPNAELVFSELRSFQYHTTMSGTVTMRAAGRAHDDIVVSLALAYHMYDGGGMLTFAYNKDEESDDVSAEPIYDYIVNGLDAELSEANRLWGSR